MRGKVISISVLLFVGLCLCDCVFGDSIWAKRDKNMRILYTDDVARQIGDILTVKITEDSKVDNKAKRDLKKEADRSAAFNGELGIDHILPSIPGFNMSASSSNELKGKADFKDERSFEDSISVVVVDILPNNNLVIMGVRDRNIAGDIQTIEVSGIVRPSDILYGNTVKSEQIANFRVVTKNSGVAEPYNRQGWLGRLFDIIWPF
ncbi:MAG: flagellar basal body L-ring protein FlgH [Sedimentisphaerales bacterium]|nr:flagellar basal body L-ring protein FlgH [Sedimentisphaerales bacterium]